MNDSDIQLMFDSLPPEKLLKNEQLAHRVLRHICWHSREKDVRVYKYEIEDRSELSYEDIVRDLTQDELDAIISVKYPLLILAEFDERSFINKNMDNIVGYVSWKLELKKGAKVQDVISVIKNMPVYGYWECKPPKLYKRPLRFPPNCGVEESNKWYILNLRFGT